MSWLCWGRGGGDKGTYLARPLGTWRTKTRSFEFPALDGDPATKSSCSSCKNKKFNKIGVQKRYMISVKDVADWDDMATKEVLIRELCVCDGWN